MNKVVRTCCQGCHTECGVLVYVENDKIIHIKGDPDHPMNHGFICARGRLQPDFLYHPDRVKYPLRRSGARGEGKWERISWEQALTEVAAKLTELKDKYGPECFSTCHGTGPRAANITTRLLGPALLSPNIISTDNHICVAPSVIAENTTLGQTVMIEKGPDYINSKCIVVWGGNPLVSHPPRGMDLLKGRKENNAKLIVIDPRRTPLAAQADMWLRIRPGTDLALAMGFINVIISENLYDKNFVSNWCNGLNELEQRAREYNLEKVSEITWVPAEQIRKAARLYAATKPAIMHHRVAVEHNINSTQTCRALAILIALTGNIDIKGGNLLTQPVPGFKTSYYLRMNEQFRLNTGTENNRIGGHEFPLISGAEAKSPFVHAGLATEAMLNGNIKALYSAGANPVLAQQETRAVWRGLLNLELHVCVEIFMTPTAELADYVLPAATWLERDECCDNMYMNFIAARQKVIEPLFEARDDMDIVIDLVKKVPWSRRKAIPWNDVKDFNEWRVRDMGMTFADFQKMGYIKVDPRYKKYETNGFDTPSRKIEIFATNFQKYGYDPLPQYQEPPISPLSTPELFQEFPLVLTTGGRTSVYFHSDGRQIKKLRKIIPEPLIEINPATAAMNEVSEGDWIRIETPDVRGEQARFKVKIDFYLDPRVVHVPHGWWFPEKPCPDHGCFESNINLILACKRPWEKICGSVAVRGTLCKIYKEKSKQSGGN